MEQATGKKRISLIHVSISTKHHSMNTPSDVGNAAYKKMTGEIGYFWCHMYSHMYKLTT